MIRVATRSEQKDFDHSETDVGGNHERDIGDHGASQRVGEPSLVRFDCAVAIVPLGGVRLAIHGRSYDVSWKSIVVALREKDRQIMIHAEISFASRMQFNFANITARRRLRHSQTNAITKLRPIFSLGCFSTGDLLLLTLGRFLFKVERRQLTWDGTTGVRNSRIFRALKWR